jgi:LPXTG-motif cell wall-anchored protein
LPSRAQLRLVTGLALAAPLAAVILAGAATANAEAAPAPGASASAPASPEVPGPAASAVPAPSAPADPAPSASASPAAGVPGDTRLTRLQLWDTSPGETGLITAGIKAAKPGIKVKASFVVSARLNVTAAREMNIPRDEQTVTIETANGTTRVAVTFTLGAQISDALVFVYLEPTDGPLAEASASATAETPGTPDSDPGNNFGTSSSVVKAATSLTGRVWADRNRDNVRGSGEPGIGRVTVALFDATGSGKKAAEPLATKANGTYTFTHVPDGLYNVVVTLPDGAWRFARPNAGADDTDSDIEADAGKRTGHATVEVKDGKTHPVDGGIAPATPGPAPSASPLPSPAAPPAAGSLPVTGAAVGGFLAAGATAVALGIGAVVVARRRRSA